MRLSYLISNEEVVARRITNRLMNRIETKMRKGIEATMKEREFVKNCIFVFSGMNGCGFLADLIEGCWESWEVSIMRRIARGDGDLPRVNESYNPDMEIPF